MARADAAPALSAACKAENSEAGNEPALLSAA